jgi:hypothetical protein
MKNLVLTFLLALLVVLTAISVRRLVVGTVTAAPAPGAIAIGTSPIPWPPPEPTPQKPNA